MRWPEGFEAWKRLRGWHERSSGEGDAALDALADIGVMRRLLDQAELAAVRAARGQAKTWAEIATRLGVTRQSAWERWRDLDDEPAATSAGRPADRLSAEEQAMELAAAALGERAESGRRALVAVPDVIGLEWDTARRVLTSAGLGALAADLDAPPPVPGLGGYAVVDQKPVAGERVAPGSAVTLWLGRGPGSAGVREPLRPHPSPRSTGGAVDEQTGESVP